MQSLFKQVPMKDTLNIIKASHEVISNLIQLIEHYLTITYFSYNNQFYEQTSGVTMGSSISPIIAILSWSILRKKPSKNQKFGSVM